MIEWAGRLQNSYRAKNPSGAWKRFNYQIPMYIAFTRLTFTLVWIFSKRRLVLPAVPSTILLRRLDLIAATRGLLVISSQWIVLLNCCLEPQLSNADYHIYDHPTIQFDSWRRIGVQWLKKLVNHLPYTVVHIRLIIVQCSPPGAKL